MAGPAVSIVIPCWNAEDSIAEAIESALAQTFPDIEVVVVDDGSTDASLEAVKSFGERVRWESGPNRGAPAARNRGLEMARGRFIQFLDADDVLYPEKLERMIVAADAAPARTLLACHRDIRGADNGEPDAVARLRTEDDPVVMALEQIVHTSAPIYPAELLREIGGYRADLDCCQDYELHLRIAMAGWRFDVLDQVLFQVRRRPGSISSNLLKVYRRQAALWDETAAALEAGGELTPPRRAALARLYAGRGRWFNRQGLFDEADSCFATAERLDARAAASAFGWRTAWLRRVLGRRLADRLLHGIAAGKDRGSAARNRRAGTPGDSE